MLTDGMYEIKEKEEEEGDGERVIRIRYEGSDGFTYESNSAYGDLRHYSVETLEELINNNTHVVVRDSAIKAFAEVI